MQMKKLLIISFVFVALLQLAVPFKMIFDQERIINSGKEYKFKIIPVDPYDAFRGRYITLSFEKNTYTILSADTFMNDETVYISLTTDSAGFADIAHVSKIIPESQIDFVSAKVNYFYDKQLTFTYPFNKFYMEETKAPNAEKVYRESVRRTNDNDSTQNGYAIVSVKDGEAALKDVIINGIYIKTLAKKDESW
jgi:hypothetical protein